MTNDKDQIKQTSTQDSKPKIDENSGVHAQGHIKIFDPETKEVLVNKRA